MNLPHIPQSCKTDVDAIVLSFCSALSKLLQGSLRCYLISSFLSFSLLRINKGTEIPTLVILHF
jgi:hypothetical protein